MPDPSDLDLGRRARRLRVDTLVRLRWLAIAGQSAAVLGTYFGLGFNLPIGLCLIGIGVSAVLNIALRLRLPRTHRLADGPAAALLAFDILQLSALLYLTGGIENPFVMLFLAPVMISAVSLPKRLTLALGTLSIACDGAHRRTPAASLVRQPAARIAAALSGQHLGGARARRRLHRHLCRARRRRGAAAWRCPDGDGARAGTRAALDTARRACCRRRA